MPEERKDLDPMEEVAKYRTTALYSLYEYCQTLELQIYDMMDRISDHDRSILQCYIDIRNDLEIATIKAFLYRNNR